MPRWRKLCKEGEEPSEFIGMEDLQRELECEHSIGWSDIPREWLPAIKELVAKIREKYTVDGAGVLFIGDNPGKITADVVIEQVKDKFGSARFYFYTQNNTPYEEIDKLVDECEKRLAKDDPYYGVPY